MKSLFVILALVFVSGCALFTPPPPTSHAKLVWDHKATGDKHLEVQDDKEISGLHAKTSLDEKGNIKDIDISVDKSGSNDAAIAAWAKSMDSMSQVWMRILDKIDQIMVAAGQAAAASKGIVIPTIPKAPIPAPLVPVPTPITPTP